MPCAVYRVVTFESEVLILEDSIGFLLLIQFVMLALNAIFASAEIAVLSFNEITSNVQIQAIGNITLPAKEKRTESKGR